MENKKEVSAVVDNREPNRLSGLFGLHDDVTSVQEEQLEVGDVLLTDESSVIDEPVVFERKSPSDFVQSIQDRRMEDQIDRMYNWFGATKSYVVVEGTVSDCVEARRGMPKTAIYGYIGSLSARWQMVPLFAGYPEMEVDLMTRVARKHFEATNRVVRSPESAPERADDSLYMRWLLALDGVGRETAENIQKELDSPEELVNAESSVLKKIDGVGDKRAEQIMLQIWDGE